MQYYMQPRIENINQKKLIGKRVTMSFAGNKTFQFWHSFMPGRKEIQNSIGTDLYSIEVYDPSYFDPFDPHKEFEKWAAIEVTGFDTLPDDMETFTLPGGLYAVFFYKGPGTDTNIFEYIFRTWLPDSNYSLDHRPHFEILGEKYKNNDPDSEEEIWIPVKAK
jgi:AraC family transcriptional regulator